MRFFYTLLFYLMIPGVLVRLLWRSRRAPGYAKRIPERFGYLSADLKKRLQPGSIWLHAVSLGEAIAAAPLIKALIKQYPNTAIIVTTTTPTGSERIQSLFKNEVVHCYAPYDLPTTVRRFLRKIQPRLAIMMETELWPNIFLTCYQQKIPIMIANARLSPKSMKGYQTIHPLTREMMRHITTLAAQSEQDAKRFIDFGLDPKRATVTGNIKFELAIPPSLWETASLLRESLGNHRSIWIAASTHEGEEEIILDAFKTVQEKVPNALLIIAPRHPERFARVAQLCRKQGYRIVLRSEKKPCEPDTQVFVADTLGELLTFYAASDVAFVGGSLVPTGGHNYLEPAACSIPILTGPHVFNFQYVYDLLTQAKALLCIENASALAEQVSTLLQDASQRETMGKAAQKIVEQNRGALSAHLTLIEKLMRR